MHGRWGGGGGGRGGGGGGGEGGGGGGENLTVPLAEFICSLKFGLRCKVRPFHLRDVLR